MSLKSKVKGACRQLCPPLIWSVLSASKQSYLNATCKKTAQDLKPDAVTCSDELSKFKNSNGGNAQDLDIYWDPAFAQELETWGNGNAWHELVFLASGWNGKVVDIACGTGKMIELLSRFSQIQVHGFDISDFLIGKAIERGIAPERLKVSDATQVDYADDEFNYSYSIGSLEHFTEDGIKKFISESRRITKLSAFHMVPVSRSGKNEGWITPSQSYFNNSVEWWVERLRVSYEKTYVLDSLWEDERSIGKWLVGVKN